MMEQLKDICSKRGIRIIHESENPFGAAVYSSKLQTLFISAASDATIQALIEALG